MKTGQFFQKESPEKNSTQMNFAKKFEESTINAEIDQSYQKLLEIIEVCNLKNSYLSSLEFLSS